MRKRSFLTAIAVIALVAATAAAYAFLRPEGAVGADQPPTNVVGTLAIDGLTPADKPIKVLAYSWGLSSSETAGCPGCGVGKVNVQDLSFTKFMDTLSPDLVRALATGQHFDSATLLVNATGLPGGAPTHRYTFRTVLLSSDSQGGSGGSRLTENVTLNFGSFHFENAS